MAKSVWAGWDGSRRAVVAGAVVVVAGAALVLMTGGVNTNGGTGPAALVLALGLAAAVRAFLPPRFERWVPGGIAGGIVLAILAISVLELVPAVRYSGDLDPFGGLLGVVGRIVFLAGSVVLALGAVLARRGRGTPDAAESGRRRPTAGRALAVLAAVAVVVGWALMTALGEGFAMRLVDALGITAVLLAAALRPAADGPAWMALLRPLLGGITVVVIVDTVLAIVPHLERIAGAPLSLVAFGIHTAALVPLIALLILDLRGPIRRARESRPPAPPAADIAPA
jgi:hypothetical protein